ncbi:tetratricopeptide repeat protein, partial [bacterium]|nr:tetratricopeptide repeat protein [bacterium]
IKGDFKEAENIIEDGLTYFPHCVNLIFNLALVKFYTGKYEKAMEELDRVLSINKYYPDAHYLKGIIYQEKGDLEKAKKEFINEININPGSKRAWKKLKEMKDEK